MSLFNEYYEINRVQCKKNLLFLHKQFEENNIFFRLGYGTLLGFIREQNFILGDNDIDLLFDKKDKDRVERLLSVFVSNGFEVRRNFENFISLSRKNNNVDFYFFSERNLIDKFIGRVTCSHGIWCVYVDSYIWEYSNECYWFGKKFFVFKDCNFWLLKNYGSDYLVPQKKKGRAKTFFSSYLCGIYLWLKPKMDPCLLKKLVLKYRSLVK